MLNCPEPASSGCNDARAGAGTELRNNDHVMAYVDVDADAATFDSGSALLTLPAGAGVRFAGLYWGANRGGSSEDPGVDPIDASKSNQVLLDTPAAGGYTPVSASVFDLGSLAPAYDFYGAFADVTELIASGGSGGYTVANLQSGTGESRHGGWALVVVFEDPASPTRNVTVFDGLVYADGGTGATDIPVAGFLTPPVGPVGTRLGAIAYDGEPGATGDGIKLEGSTVGDALNPGADFFNSSMTRLGSMTGGRNPVRSTRSGSTPTSSTHRGCSPTATHRRRSACRAPAKGSTRRRWRSRPSSTQRTSPSARP